MPNENQDHQETIAKKILGLTSQLMEHLSGKQDDSHLTKEAKIVIQLDRLIQDFRKYGPFYDEVEMIASVRLNLSPPKYANILAEFNGYLEKKTGHQKDMETVFAEFNETMHEHHGFHKDPFRGPEAVHLILSPIATALGGACMTATGLIRLGLNVLSSPFYKNEDLRIQVASAQIGLGIIMLLSSVVVPFSRVYNLLFQKESKEGKSIFGGETGKFKTEMANILQNFDVGHVEPRSETSGPRPGQL